MLQEMLQPHGQGIWWALGLVLVHLVLGGVLLWAPGSIRPTFMSRPSIWWFAYMGMGWVVACLLMTQIGTPDYLPRTVQADMASSSATIVSYVGGLAFALGLVLFAQQKWDFIGLRNFAVAFSLVLCTYYAATLLQHRAYTYVLVDPALRPLFRWDVEVYQHLLVSLLFSTGTVLERTIRLARRERKELDEAFSRLPLPALGVYQKTHKVDAGWLSWHRRQVKIWMQRPRRAKDQWWEYILPLIAMFPTLGLPYPFPRGPEKDDESAD